MSQCFVYKTLVVVDISIVLLRECELTHLRENSLHFPLTRHPAVFMTAWGLMSHRASVKPHSRLSTERAVTKVDFFIMRQSADMWIIPQKKRKKKKPHTHTLTFIASRKKQTVKLRVKHSRKGLLVNDLNKGSKEYIQCLS